MGFWGSNTGGQAFVSSTLTSWPDPEPSAETDMFCGSVHHGHVDLSHQVSASVTF